MTILSIAGASSSPPPTVMLFLPSFSGTGTTTLVGRESLSPVRLTKGPLVVYFDPKRPSPFCHKINLHHVHAGGRSNDIVEKDIVFRISADRYDLRVP